MAKAYKNIYKNKAENIKLKTEIKIKTIFYS